MTEAGITTTYTWNARNQLTAISNPGFSATFSYNSFGRRTGKTIAGATTNFVYDGLNPVQEKTGQRSRPISSPAWGLTNSSPELLEWARERS